MITVRKIQNLLLHHPIYNWMKDDSDIIEVLVVGEGEYTETFVDNVMELVQVLGKELVIRWCTDSLDVKDKYLEKRPALHEFVNIDGELDESDLDVYGQLIFAKLDDYLSDESANAVYAFVSTGNDDDNEETAKIIKEAISEDCLCAYVLDDEIAVYAIDSREEDEQDKIYDLIASEEELIRMAFNAHFVWEGTGNIDLEKAKKRFCEDEYNMASSCGLVLSIPYKLASIGVEYTSLEDAIEKLTQSEEYDEYMWLLAYLEHRRWVIGLLTSGFSPMRSINGKMDYSECIARKSVKDKANKIHPCLVRSTGSAPLILGDYSSSKSLWDKASIADEELDELDKFSVDIHRAMLKEAKKLKREGTIERTTLFDNLEKIKVYVDVQSISSGESGLERSKRLKKNYDRYDFCIKNIVDNSLPYAVQFETYEKDLVACVDDSSVLQAIQEIRNVMFPALEACLYRDYKKYDMEFCEKLPFILSNKFDSKLCLVFNIANNSADNNNEMFKNVASATALYAKTVNYLFRVTKDTNLEVFETKVKRLKNYFEYRGFKSEILFNIFTSETDEKLLKSIEKKMKLLKTKGFIDDYAVSLGAFETIVEQVCDVIRSCDYFDGINAFSNSSFESLVFTEKVINTGVSYFEFDSYNRTFNNCINNKNLKYIPVTSFIQVEDMFSLMKAEDKEFNYQDYADSYHLYWRIYCGDDIDVPEVHDQNKKFALCATCWTQLAEVLKESSITNRPLRTAREDKCGINTSLQLKVIKRMLNKLEERGILASLSINDSNNTVTATFASNKCKAMFSKAGDVLETYVYFEACKLSWFDDIQTGYKFKWEKGEVENEMDGVLTKGYRTILLECKSVVTPSEDYYLKLDSLANRFGINCKKVMVLVTDMHPSDSERLKARETLKSRGDQLDVVTISSKNDLDNIGKKLQSIMMS